MWVKRPVHFDMDLTVECMEKHSSPVVATDREAVESNTITYSII